MITILICDDSAFMRSLIRSVLERDGGFEVVGEAADAFEARAAIKALLPDVLTLDVEMPRMDGLSFLEKIMRLRPMPVVMVSTLTQAGADITLNALELGAADAVLKPSPAERNGFERFAEDLRSACLAAGQSARPAHYAQPPLAAPANAHSARYVDGVIGIGASTGGVEALRQILPSFPRNAPPIAVVQHMPAEFTRRFAERLNDACAIEVREAEDAMPLQAGLCVVAPGGRHLRLVGGPGGFVCRLGDEAAVSGHRPSADVLFASIAANAGNKGAGLLLTGMGRDGAEGLLKLRRAGGFTFGQNEASCLIYGMPRAADDIGASAQQAALQDLPALALRCLSANPDLTESGQIR